MRLPTRIENVSKPRPTVTRSPCPSRRLRTVRLFLYDRVRGTLDSPFADSANLEAVRPIWSSDGKIAGGLTSEVVSQLAVFRPDSPASAETTTASGNFMPSSWLLGGEFLIGS